MKKIGKKLRELRKSKGMSQVDVSFKSGINRVTVSYAESGKQVYVSTLEAIIVKGLEMDIASFMLLCVDDSDWSPNRKEMFRLYLPHVLEVLKD